MKRWTRTDSIMAALVASVTGGIALDLFLWDGRRAVLTLIAAGMTFVMGTIVGEGGTGST